MTLNVIKMTEWFFLYKTPYTLKFYRQKKTFIKDNK